MKMVMGLVLAVMTMLCSEASAQSDCTNALMRMSPCLDYITGNATNPTSLCCSQLSNVVRSSPDCLCSVLNGDDSQLGINVNRTQALELPRACKVQTPPVSSCNGGSSDSPANSPTGSPNTSGGSSDSSADSPTGSPNTTGTGSKTAPSTEGNGSSDGNSIKSSLSLLTLIFAALLVAF